MPKFKSLTCNQLKKILQANELEITGIKNELVLRLIGALETDEIDSVQLNDILSEQTAPVQEQINELKSMIENIATSVSIISQNMETQGERVIDIERAQPSGTRPSRNANNTETSAYRVGQTDLGNEVRESPIPETATDIRAINHTLRDVIAMFPEFDPLRDQLTSRQFIDKIDSLARTYGWHDSMKLCASQSKLRGHAKTWVDAQDVFQTWPSFVEALLSDFPCEINAANVHTDMVKTHQTRNENIVDYYYKMLAMGRRGRLDDRSIIWHTINGLNDENVRRTLNALRYEKCSEFLKAIIGIQPNRTSSQPTTVLPRFKNQPDTDPKPTGVKREFKAPVCYNCNEPGHISINCPKPQKRSRCISCNKVHPSGEPSDCGKKTMNVRKTDCVAQDLGSKTVKVDGLLLVARIDTGSDCDLIKKTIADRISGVREQCYVRITGIGGGTRHSYERLRARVNIDGVNEDIEFYVIDDDVIDTDILLGQPLFKHERVRVIISGGKTKFEPVQYTANSMKSARTAITEESLQCGIHDRETKKQLIDLVNEHRDVFSTGMDEIGKTDLISMRIDLKTTDPVMQPPYRIPEKKKNAVTEMVDELLRNGIIERSQSNYASPVLLHKKKDGSDRLCVDYRRLNAITEQEIHPLPNIEEQLHEAKQYTLFTVLDLNCGYSQVPIDPESRKFTAFVTTDGLYQFCRMPFGLKNAPAVFLRLMSKLKDRTQKGDMLHYMDDILIGATTVEEMLTKLRRVLGALRQGKLTLNIKKCEFIKHSISFLGHELTPGGISPGNVKTKAIEDFPAPTCVPDVRRFLGLSGYFRKFVPGYAVLSEPLRMLLRKDQPFIWGRRQDEAFVKLKNALITKPVLTAYRADAEHSIHTDASAIGLAAVLLQNEGVDLWKPVIYFSRSTTDAERKFHSFELETLAVVEALERFRYYVYGKPIKVLTDCNAVKSAMTKRDLVPRIGRWWLRVQDFEVTIEHRPAGRMEHVDALSRSPLNESQVTEEATLRIDKVELSEEDWLISLQLADENLQAKVKELNKSPIRENDQFIVDKGRLFHKTNGQKLWVVPRALRWKVVHDCHDNAGHLALDNTLERIKRTMWFSRMRNFVKSYIRACVECAYNKRGGKKTEGEYHCDDVPAVPFKVVHLDHLGPFPKSKKQNEHILVLVDAFTKFTIVRAVKSTKTRHVLNILDEVSEYFGMPECLVTDRGTSFTSKEFEKYCNENNIKHIKNAVRSPRANGHAERTNRTILDMLLTSTEHDKIWDEKLRSVQWSLNTLRNKTTQRTPHELLYSFTPRDILKNKIVLVLQQDDTNVTEEELVDIRQRAAERINAERKKTKQRFDEKHAKPSKYEVGNLVLVEHEPPSTGTSRKLEPRFRGPFTVTKVLGHDRYMIEDLPGSRRKQRHYTSVYASDKMRKWRPISDNDDDPPTPDKTNSDSEEDDQDTVDEDISNDRVAELISE